MNRYRLRRGERRGFTLTEVLVSMGLFGIAIPSLLGGMLFCYGAVKKNSHQITALECARRKLEYVMSVQYASLSAGTAYDETDVPLDSAGRPRADIFVTVTAPAGATRKLITVSVRWEEQGRALDVTLYTLVSRNNVT